MCRIAKNIVLITVVAACSSMTVVLGYVFPPMFSQQPAHQLPSCDLTTGQKPRGMRSLPQRYLILRAVGGGSNGGDSVSVASSIMTDVPYLKKDFDIISNGGATINFSTFMKWEEIQALIEDDLLKEEEGEQIWLSCVGSLDGEADFSTFCNINAQLDDMFEEIDDDEGSDDSIAMQEYRESEEEDEDDGVVVSADIAGSSVDEGKGSEANGGGGGDNRVEAGIVMDEQVDVWEPLIDATSLFEPEFIAYLQRFFYSVATNEASNGIPATTSSGNSDSDTSGGGGGGNIAAGERLISFTSFVSWQDVREMVSDGSLDVMCLKDLWQEAVQAKHLHASSSSTGTTTSVSPIDSHRAIQLAAEMFPLGATAESLVQIHQQPKFMLNFDLFVRLNFRTEEVIEDISASLNAMTDKDVEAFYRECFAQLVKGSVGVSNSSDEDEDEISDGRNNGKTKYLTYDQLMRWDMVAAMLDEKEITQSQLDQLWAAVPKESFNSTPETINVTGKGFGQSLRPPVKVEGITVDTFVMLNHAMEDSISALQSTTATTTTTTTTTTGAK